MSESGEYIPICLTITWRKDIGFKIREHRNKQTNNFTQADLTKIYAQIGQRSEEAID
jgi:hypothetical protein